MSNEWVKEEEFEKGYSKSKKKYDISFVLCIIALIIIIGIFVYHQGYLSTFTSKIFSSQSDVQDGIIPYALVLSFSPTEIPSACYRLSRVDNNESYYDYSITCVNDTYSSVNITFNSQKASDGKNDYVPESQITLYKNNDKDSPVIINRELEKNITNLNLLQGTYQDGDTATFSFELNPQKDSQAQFGEHSAVIVRDGSFYANSISTNITTTHNTTHLILDNTTAPFDSLIFYQSFDGDIINNTAYDWAKSYNGTYRNGTFINYSCGLGYGACAQFDGQDDFINFTTTIGIPSRALNSSVSIWVHSYDVTKTQDILTRTTDTNNRNHIQIIGSEVRAGTFNTSSDAERSASGAVTNGWHHIAVVFNDTNATLYIDNILQTGGNVVSTVSNPAFQIGFRPDRTRAFNGSMDELMIFNTTLTAAQVSAIYNNQSTRFVARGTLEPTWINLSIAGNTFVNISLQNYGNILNSTIALRIGTWNITQKYKNWDLGSHYLVDDGEDDVMNVPDSDSLSKQSNLTISLWINYTGRGETNARIMEKYSGVDPVNNISYMLLMGTNGRIEVSFNTTTTHLRRATSTNFTINNQTWYHIVATYNGTAQIYVNGVKENAAGIGGQLVTTSNQLSIGARPNGGLSFNGTIDEIRMFNRSFNDAEVLALYYVGRDDGYWSDISQKAYWSFNDDTATDSISNNVGTLTNGAFISNTLGNNLLGYWSLDNNAQIGENASLAVDNTGRNNGTLLNGTLWNETGYIEGGAFFNGDTTRPVIEIANPSTFNLTANFSFGAWVNQARLAANQNGIISKSTTSGSSPYRLVGGQTGNRVVCDLRNATGANLLFEATASTTNRWVHYFCTYNATNALTIYKNGEYSNSTIITGQISSNAVNLYIGSRLNDANGAMNGTIDEVMIFNRSLSSDDIKRIYLHGRMYWNYNTTYQNMTDAGNLYNISLNTKYALPDYIFYTFNSTNLFASPYTNATQFSFQDPVPTFSNEIISPSSPTTWIPALNVSFNITVSDITDFVSTVYLNFNGTNYTANNLTASVYNVTIYNVAGGNWTYYWWANDSHNQSAQTTSVSYNVTPARSIVTLLLNGTANNLTITYPSQVNASAVGQNGTLTLFRDGTDITASNHLFQNLAVGYYNFTGRIVADSNFSGATTTFFANITGGLVTCGLNSTSPLQYPQSAAVNGSCTNPEATAILYRNNVSVANPFTGTLGVGTWVFKLNVTSQNYSYAEANATVIVNINGTLVPTLVITPSTTVTYPTATTATGSNCPTELTCALARDGVGVSNPETITLAVGSYVYNFSTAGNANYSATSRTSTLTVNRGAAEIGLFLNQTRGNMIFYNGSQVNITARIVTGETSQTIQIYQDNVIINNGSSPQQNLSVFTSFGTFSIRAEYLQSQNYTGDNETWTITVLQFPNRTCSLTQVGTTTLSSGQNPFVQLCHGLEFSETTLYAKQGEPYTILVPIKNNDYSQTQLATCTLSLSATNGSEIVRNVNANFTQGYCTYNLSSIQTNLLGDIRADLQVNNNADQGFSIFRIRVTPSGDALTTSQAILYFISLILLTGLFCLSLYGSIRIKWSNSTDVDGNIVSVNDLKYVKLFLWWMTYVLSIAISYLMWNITYGYLQFQGAANIFNAIFWILISFFYPITVFALLVMLIRFVYDKRIKKAIDSGLQGIPA